MDEVSRKGSSLKMRFKKRPQFWLLVIIVSLCCVVGVSVFVIVPRFLGVFSVSGTTMAPGIDDGERVLVYKKTNGFRRGQIILFYFQKNHSRIFVKRIIGVPGDLVEMRKGKVLVNGVFIEEPYVSSSLNLEGSSMPAARVLGGSFFVLGDNRDSSVDSRHWGDIPGSQIVGIVLRHK